MRRIREEYSRIPPQDDGQLRELIANYYGMISLIDHNVGRMLEALAAQGLADNTLVIFTTDHGDWLGDHGLILKGPMHYEGLLRVGMIARGPGVPAGVVNAEPVSTLDLAATFADYAGIDASWARHSRSLRPLIEDGTRGVTRDFAFNEWHLLPSRTGIELQLRTVRTKSAKLTIDLLSGAGELYDLANDPFEMENRFDVGGALKDELLAMAMPRPADERPPQVQVGAA
jgi:arylsulfatase A-like enzyme